MSAQENEYPGRGAFAERMHVRVDVETKTGLLATATGIEAEMVDISLGGLGFVSRVHIPPEAGISLNFSLPGPNGKPFVFYIQGNLIHSTYAKHRNGYMNGFEFGQLTQEQMDVLRAYISRIIKNHLANLWAPQ
jgi:c-di-GMP-binding flagellar brake protein YcgR